MYFSPTIQTWCLLYLFSLMGKWLMLVPNCCPPTRTDRIFLWRAADFRTKNTCGAQMHVSSKPEIKPEIISVNICAPLRDASPAVAVWGVCGRPPPHWQSAAATPGGFESACPEHSSSSVRSRTQNPFHSPPRRSPGAAGKHHLSHSPNWKRDRERRRMKHSCPLLVNRVIKAR